MIVDVQEAKENVRNVQKISHLREVSEALFILPIEFREQRVSKTNSLVILVGGVCFALPLLALFVELKALLLEISMVDVVH